MNRLHEYRLTMHHLRVVLLVLLLIVLGSVVLGAFHAPFGYDESYNLQVPLNLASGHGYASNGALYPGGSPQPFDPIISTGPTLLLPVAGAVWLLGEHAWVYRVIPVLAFAAMVALAATVGRRVSGWWGGLASAGAVLMIDPAHASYPSSPIFGAGDVLGEVTASALVLASAVLLDRSCRISGVALGLAIMSKTLIVLVLPAFVLGCLLSAWRSRPQDAPALPVLVSRLVSFLALVAAPALVWQAVRLVVLGWRRGLEVDRAFLTFVATGGSGLTGREPGHIWGPGLSGRLDMLMRLSLPVVGLLLVGTLLLVLVSGSGPRRGRGWIDRLAPMELALLGGGLTIAVWWLLFSDRDYVRHVVPGLYMLLPVVLALAVAKLQRLGPRRSHVPVPALAWLTGVALVFGVVAHGVRAWHAPGASLSVQRRVAQLMDAEASSIAFRGWYQDPEIALLASVPARRLEVGGARGVLVLGARQRDRDPVGYRRGLSFCRITLLRLDGYVACIPQRQQASPPAGSR